MIMSLKVQKKSDLGLQAFLFQKDPFSRQAGVKGSSYLSFGESSVVSLDYLSVFHDAHGVQLE
jgi:hypothetical protein